MNSKALIFSFLLLTPFVSPNPGDATPPSQKPPKLVVISWDGAPDWVVDRLLYEDHLPHLVALSERGTRAAYSRTSMPSKTAVGHATLWTGAWPGETGVLSNTVPRRGAEHTLLDHQRGFESTVLQAEPLFLTAALDGRKVVLLSATHNDPPDPLHAALEAAGLPTDRLITFSGFQKPIARGRLFEADILQPLETPWPKPPPHDGEPLEVEIRVGDSRVHGLVYDDPARPTEGYDSLLLRAGHRGNTKDQAVIVPRSANSEAQGWSPPLPAQRGRFQGGVLFRLFELSPDGSRMALYRREASGMECGCTEDELRAYLEAYPVFHDDAFWRYRDGNLGTPLPDGGDGTAEERLLEIVKHDTQLLEKGTRFAFEHWQPDLLWHYSPMTDSAGHTWMGILDPHSPSHNPDLAAKVWPYYIQVFQALDHWLGQVVALAGDDSVVALVTDHGMQGATELVYTHRILEEASLLKRTEDDKIDLTQTKILGAGADFSLHVNDTEHHGGIVPQEERETVIQAAQEALLAARHPETGQALFRQVLTGADRAPWGLDHPGAADLYLDPAPGLYPTGRLGDEVVRVRNEHWGMGVHGYLPERRKMHGIFYLAGPGVPVGERLPPIEQIDIAPTLAHLLGLRAPSGSRGRVLIAGAPP